MVQLKTKVCHLLVQTTKDVLTHDRAPKLLNTPECVCVWVGGEGWGEGVGSGSVPQQNNKRIII